MKLVAEAPDHVKCAGASYRKGSEMSCEHLICAHCASPVVEGRCPVCRAARAEIHHHGPTLTPQLLIAVALLLMLGLLIATHVVP